MIEIRDLCVRFRDGSGIAYKDTVFGDGKSYVLLGASGCGKSTLLNVIAGILAPARGSVVVSGTDIARLSQKQKDALRIRDIGYIFQDFKLIEDMTVADNIAVLELEGVDTSGMDALLERLGMLPNKNKRVRRLSGGEKQRVAIARALVKKPKLILADEPTGNLNYAIGRKIAEELLESAKGNTLLCVTHDDRLAELFDVTVRMDDLAQALGGEEDA